MKYSDEEMAEAALALAHTDTTTALTPELEAVILQRANAVARDVRFSTTKAGAIEVDLPIAPVLPIGARRSSGVVAYLGWLAAAACVALVVYAWRSNTASSGPQPSASASSVLRDGNGNTVAEIHLDRDGDATIKVIHLKAEPGRRFQVWTSPSDALHSAAAGSFSCEPPVGCDGRELAIPHARSDGQALPTNAASSPTSVWLTTSDGVEPARPTDSTAIVASGGIARSAAVR